MDTGDSKKTLLTHKIHKKEAKSIINKLVGKKPGDSGFFFETIIGYALIVYFSKAMFECLI